MSFVIVRWSFEDQVDSWVALPKQEWDEYLAKVKGLKFPVLCDFGDEKGGLTFDSFKEYMEDFEVDEIPEKEYEMLLQRFYGGTGDFPWLELS